MPDGADFESFVPAGLDSLGIEADEAELGVMRAAHELYWPVMRGLLEAELPPIAAEADPDVSRAPE